MKEGIIMAKKKIKNDIMLVTYNHDRQAILNEESWVYTDSLNIAKTIEQEHKATMRNIRKVLEEYSLKNRRCSSNTDLRYR